MTVRIEKHHPESLVQNECFVILNGVKDLYPVGKDRFFAALRMTKEEKV
jgi:hypothetical protein